MHWLSAWWRQLVGRPESEPWDDDPRIIEERRGQHARIDKVTAELARQQLRERRIRTIEEAWRRGDVQH